MSLCLRPQSSGREWEFSNTLLSVELAEGQGTVYIPCLVWCVWVGCWEELTVTLEVQTVLKAHLRSVQLRRCSIGTRTVAGGPAAVNINPASSVDCLCPCAQCNDLHHHCIYLAYVACKNRSLTNNANKSSVAHQRALLINIDHHH